MTVRIETFYACTKDVYTTSKVLQKSINDFLAKNRIKNVGDVRITAAADPLGLHGLVLYEAEEKE